MEFVLYQQPSCPFCKHFQRLFYKYIPEGKEVVLPNHECEIWTEKNIDFVPTVIAYENGVEVDRLGAKRLIGIRKGPWLKWLKKMKDEYGAQIEVE